MASVTDGFDIPIMHQDLRDLSLGQINMPYGSYFGYPSTNLLGGIQMRPILNNDQVLLKNKSSNSCLKTFKTVALAAAAILTAGALKGRYNSWTKPGWLTKLFSKTPPAP